LPRQLSGPCSDIGHHAVGTEPCRLNDPADGLLGVTGPKPLVVVRPHALENRAGASEFSFHVLRTLAVVSPGPLLAKPNARSPRGASGPTAAKVARTVASRASRPPSDLVVDAVLWALAVACAAGTIWFSFGAPPPGAALFPGADKAGHAIAYFATTLSFLFAAVWRPGRGPGRFPRLGWLVPVAAVGVGGAVEILQGLTPARTAELNDVVAEVLGSAAAMAVHALVRWWARRRLVLTSQV
jgi:VanZ family protein